MKIRLVILFAALSLLGAAEPQKVKSVPDLVDDAFEIGLQLGWTVRDAGGTRDDIAIFADSKRKNDPEIVRRWFEAHRKTFSP